MKYMITVGLTIATMAVISKGQYERGYRAGAWQAQYHAALSEGAKLDERVARFREVQAQREQSEYDRGTASCR